MHHPESTAPVTPAATTLNITGAPPPPQAPSLVARLDTLISQYNRCAADMGLVGLTAVFAVAFNQVPAPKEREELVRERAQAIKASFEAEAAHRRQVYKRITTPSQSASVKAAYELLELAAAEVQDLLAAEKGGAS